MKNIPERMCIACRTKLPKNQMLRIVKDKEGNISLDFTGKKSGRGAYICDNPECIKKCAKANILAKVFEMPINAEMYEEIINQYANKQN